MNSRDKRTPATGGSAAAGSKTARATRRTKAPRDSGIRQSQPTTSGATAAGSVASTTKKNTGKPPTKDNTIKANKKALELANKRGLSSSKEGQFTRNSSNGSIEAFDTSEMTTTNLLTEEKSSLISHGDVVVEQETDIDQCGKQTQETDEDESTTLLDSSSSSKGGDDLSIQGSGSAPIKLRDLREQSKQMDSAHPLPDGWEQHVDKAGPYFWHVATGIIQRTRPTSDQVVDKESLVLCHDDEEINQTSTAQRTSSDEEEYLESGAALTLADETTINDDTTFVVYPLGSCDFDETQLVSATSTKAIQKCILRLSNKPTKEESMCWGLDQSHPILMRLVEDYIQFTDLKSNNLLRSQPIFTIKTWAVDDDNNFAFVVEDKAPGTGAAEDSDEFYNSVDYALLSEPSCMCYVFRSLDDDDMSCRVAAKLTEEINRYRTQMSHRISKSTRLQQMVDQHQQQRQLLQSTSLEDQQTDAEGDEFDDMEESSEMSMDVKYIGKVQVPRPVGIDVLNIAIDRCLAEASKAQLASRARASSSGNLDTITSETTTKALSSQSENNEETTLIEAKLHVSPSSVIVENVLTGEIIVECRIRYLTFMGISRRDIRWCAFIMQNTTNKTFVAHCFECYPTAGHICEAIQASCSKMYEKVVKNQRDQLNRSDTKSIIPKNSTIRDTLAKTLSRIKLSPIIQ